MHEGEVLWDLSFQKKSTIRGDREFQNLLELLYKQFISSHDQDSQRWVLKSDYFPSKIFFPEIVGERGDVLSTFISMGS